MWRNWKCCRIGFAAKYLPTSGSALARAIYQGIVDGAGVHDRARETFLK